MNRLLLDHGLATRAALILRQYGFDAVHVGELGMGSADDLFILNQSRQQDRVCVTLDHDFHAHLAVTGLGRPSVLLLRIEGLNAQGQADLIRSVCIECGDALGEGAAVSADGKRVRVRRLPLK